MILISENARMSLDFGAQWQPFTSHMRANLVFFPLGVRILDNWVIWGLKGSKIHMAFNAWKDSHRKGWSLFYVCGENGVQGVRP